MKKMLCPLFIFFLLITDAPADSARGLIILLSDRGAGSDYIGSVKGVVYSACPGARIDSITHSVPRFDTVTGARILRDAARDYPPGTVFLALVGPDHPGESGVAVETVDGKYFVGPDNGVLSLAVRVPGVKKQHRVSSDDALRQPAFPGRDLLAPAAGRLARGTAIEDLGPETGSIAGVKTVPPSLQGRVITGTVTLIDNDGNIVTDIPPRMLEEAGIVVGDMLEFGYFKKRGSIIFTELPDDAPPFKMLCYAGPRGFLELGMSKGSLTNTTGIARGTLVTLEKPLISPSLRETLPSTSPLYVRPDAEQKPPAVYTPIDISVFEGAPLLMEKYDLNRDGTLSGSEFYNYVDWADRQPGGTDKLKPDENYLLMRGKRHLHRVRPRSFRMPYTPAPPAETRSMPTTQEAPPRPL